MTDNKPTFHHMNSSQSQRILWLLEELSIPYTLISHLRNPPTHPTAPFLSPSSLKALGPYGKAPILFTGTLHGNRYIPETSAIATYLIRTFDTEDKFGLKNGDYVRDEILTSICQTGLSRSTTFMMMLDFGLIRNGSEEMGPAGKRFDGPEMRAVLREVERELREGPEGGYFMGKHPGRADIMFEFPLSSIKQRGYLDLKAEFPLLDEWLERVYSRPAWKRGIEKGNGYDLTIFPRKLHL